MSAVWIGSGVFSDNLAFSLPRISISFAGNLSRVVRVWIRFEALSKCKGPCNSILKCGRWVKNIGKNFQFKEALRVKGGYIEELMQYKFFFAFCQNPFRFAELTHFPD